MRSLFTSSELFQLLVPHPPTKKEKKKSCSASESAAVICGQGHSRPGIGLPKRFQLDLGGRQMSGIWLLRSRKDHHVRAIKGQKLNRNTCSVAISC